MDLKPIGNRLIVKPESAATASASGAIVFPDRYDKPPAITGTVVAVGNGPLYLHRARAAVLKSCREIVQEFDESFNHPPVTQCILDEIGRYSDGLVHGESELQVGDYVAFAYTSGSKMTVDGEELIVLNEDEIEAVWKPEETAA